MPKFLATIKDQTGSTRTMVVEALDRNSAVMNIQHSSYFVISIDEVDSSKMLAQKAVQQAKKKYTHNKAKLSDISSFAKQLAVMLEAGVPLLRSVSVISDQMECKQLAEILFQVRADVESGQSFSKSLAKHPQVFSQFWVSLVEVGEASGTMPRVLRQLTEYMEQAEKFQAQIVGAMIYPLVLVAICTGAVLVFALFVGPTFEKIFIDMNMDLPGLTVMMLALFKFIKTYFILLVGAAVGSFIAFMKFISGPGRLMWETLLLNMPGFGPVVKMILIEKFASQMAILIESGVPILYALEISERLVDNLICGEIIKNIREAVKEGKLLAEPMENSGFFPAMTVQMIRVGEETGELGQMLKHVANYYKTIVEDFMKHIGTMIEPIMLVVMGGVIGTIVVSMFLPLLSLSGG